MFEYNRKSSLKHGVSSASLSTPLPDVTDLGRQDGGWLGHSHGNHKETWLLHISKHPKDEAGRVTALVPDYFIIYSQVCLGSIVTALNKCHDQFIGLLNPRFSPFHWLWLDNWRDDVGERLVR